MAKSAKPKKPKSMPPTSNMTRVGQKMTRVGKAPKMKTGMESQFKPRQAGGANY